MTDWSHDPLAEGLERRRPWLWLLAVLFGTVAAVRPFRHGRVDVVTVLDAVLGASWWVLLTWRYASRADRDAPTLWRRLTWGWVAWLAGFVVLVLVSTIDHRFDARSLVTLVLPILALTTVAFSWRRTARGLPFRPTPEERARRKQRDA